MVPETQWHRLLELGQECSTTVSVIQTGIRGEQSIQEYLRCPLHLREVSLFAPPILAVASLQSIFESPRLNTFPFLIENFDKFSFLGSELQDCLLRRLVWELTQGTTHYDFLGRILASDHFQTALNHAIAHQ